MKSNPIPQYLSALSNKHFTGIATEHTYRPDLECLLNAMLPNLLVTNEPKQIECGAPDFVLTRNQIPLGYIEAKDIGKNLDDVAHKEQLTRYTESLGNLIFTNYLEFRLIRDGKRVSTVNIGEIANGKIKRKAENFDTFTTLLETFIVYQGQTITTADGLARHMAYKARMLAQVITQALQQDEHVQTDTKSTLQGQLDGFKKYLIHDFEAEAFADVYAQTVAYGMFAARLHDPIPETFTRREAAELIPVTNPFLRKFFQHIAGYELDERIHWIVDNLADIFRAADVGELMKDYGRATARNDPFLHFYETFLKEYNPNLRKRRGVYYTPEPVVNFIVRAVDDILQNEFNLPLGLADTSKTIIEIDGQPSTDRRKKGRIEKYEKEVHKVQILDPAAGTGTFLAAIVQEVHDRYFSNQKGIWPDYARKELVPRLNGFEVLMASYAMAHTKLEMVLRDSGCELDNDRRLHIYLTNSLEKYHPDTGTLFTQWLSAEANEANFIKRDTPVMVVVGNPPYSGESANKGEWIADLLETYKQEPSGGKLQERNAKWLNDDYVKFIRYGQYHIERTREGILAYVNPHGFLDNQTFRGMRWSLLRSFDKIYIIDLHGNSKKNETAPDGSTDKNVFDIQQGVSINLFVKTGEKGKNSLAQVFHHDVYGVRESKYQFLWENNLAGVGFKELKPSAPQYFFVPKNYDFQTEYNKGFDLNALFLEKSVGIVTARDNFTIHHTPHSLKATMTEFLNIDDEAAREKFSLGKDVKDWKVSLAREDLEKNVEDNDKVLSISYRPFDIRYTYYTGNSKGFHCRPREKVMRHFLLGGNVGLVVTRQTTDDNWSGIHISDHMIDNRYHFTYRGIPSQFPLYLYSNTKLHNIDGLQNRKPNLNQNIVQAIADRLSLHFESEKIDNDVAAFSPMDLLDYIYAVLHSPSYRERYKEFLKTDFPRVPYPTDIQLFRKLVKLGGELRVLHLMESPALEKFVTGYPASGDNIVSQLQYQITDVKTRTGKVNINQTQYFEDVPETAWNFHIGGYQPAQKWLKDRKGRTLDHNDIMHYQRIIVALIQTNRIMQDIDGSCPTL